MNKPNWDTIRENTLTCFIFIIWHHSYVPKKWNRQNCMHKAKQINKQRWTKRKKTTSTENETTKRNLLILIHFMSFIRCSVHAECLHAVFQRNCICAVRPVGLLFFFSHLQYSQSTGIGFDCAFRKNWHWVLFDPQQNERRNEPWPKNEKKEKNERKNERMKQNYDFYLNERCSEYSSATDPISLIRMKISAAFCLVNKQNANQICWWFFFSLANNEKQINLSTHN